MYATREDLILHYGSMMISELEASKTSPGNPKEAVTNKQLANATGIINGYLAKDYVLPIIAEDEQLNILCCQIAVYLLYTRQAPDDIRNRYKDAINWLKDVQKGIVELTFAIKLSDVEREELVYQQPVVMNAYSMGDVFSDDILNKMPGFNPR